MSKHVSEGGGKPISLSDDEVAIVEFYRALRLDRDEALRRLATPPVSPILPPGQELQANLSAVAEDLTPPDPTADYPTRP